MPIKPSSSFLRGLSTFTSPLARRVSLNYDTWRPLHNVPRILASFRRPFRIATWNQLSQSALHVDSKMSSGPTHENRLAQAKSPYLLQHASNPVDWYEWSGEAFRRAAAENKPIFLSVGYSACHWCHVLAHESFENGEIARVMNEHFINIKVDREERPDVDRLYMTFVQATSGRGGWPMSVWLTPELAPFFAGTYFPTSTFKLLCEKIASTWASDPDKVRDHADSIIQLLRNATKTETITSIGQIDLGVASKKLFNKWKQDFDPNYAGFGDAPKFPSPSLSFNPLLRHAYYTDIPDEKTKAVDMVAQTLLAIYRGGINDHVGKGIARYSVDAEWRLPHFEKMLYDQAQLTTSALECSLLVKDPEIKNELQRMAADIIEYAERDIRSPKGAFYSAEDADSLPATTATVKQEGAFYVWRKSEVDSILDEHSPLFADYFGIKESGNIDPANDAHGELNNQNQLYIRIPLSELATKHGFSIPEAKKIIEASLDKLKQYRDANRPRPQIDDKIVTAWNGLMLTALSLAASILPPDMVYRNNIGVASSSLKMAESIARFAKDYLWDASRRELSRSWRDGPGPAGVCEDYAALVTGLLDLYEATGDEGHLLFAKELQERQDELFWDDDGGGYFASRADDRHILIRLKESQDGAEPSTSSLSVSNLYRLSYLITAEESRMKTRAEKLVASQTNMLERAPHVLGMMLGASHIGTRGMKQIIVTGTRGDAATEDVLHAIRSQFVPNRSLIFIDPAAPPTGLAKHNKVVQSLIDGLSGKDLASPTLPEVRICDGHVCGLPLRKDELTNLVV